MIDHGEEQEILFQQLTDAVEVGLKYSLNATAGFDDDTRRYVAALAATGVLRRLRVMSGRQVAVVLSGEPNRHERWVIQEPPPYVQEGVAP